ncbi:MAG: prolyl oligopeptidase family serine peptidase [Gammaproteobacteria bacterium]|nr:prolyl oligopeptidase family serine peptidase [Gammaproteobacteria bacterium]
MPPLRLFGALIAALAIVGPVALAKSPVTADEVTRSLLREAEFNQISISPDGKLLAIARTTGKVASVTLHKREDLSPIITFDPGANGAITDLSWVDDSRLIIGATRIDPVDGYAAIEPILVIMPTDGSKPFELPGNFFAVVKDDPDHILVSTCGFHPDGGGCNVPEIRKSDIKRLIKRGELLLSGPKDTQLIANRQANAGFAIKWEDDGTSKAYVRSPGNAEWTLINDGSKTGLEVVPVAVARDGSSGFLQSQRKHGPDVIERYEFATGNRTELYADPDTDPVDFVGSLDGKELIGALYGPTQPRYHFWRPDDADAKMLAELQAAFPGRLADVASASKDGNMLVVFVYSDREPGAFYLFDRVARKAKIITRTNPWIDPLKQGPQRGVSFPSRDGLPLHGLLTLPPGSSGKNLPLVVLPHGGPYEVTDVWGYDPELQILAQHGYAVLQVNFRGSGGYGREFIDRGTRQWGRAMQDDVTDATRWAIAQGIADAKRICIYGASYGAYAALMGPIREPGLYQCAVGLSGVFDLAKMYKWGSIRRSDFGQLYLKRVLGEDQAELAANSPALLADRIGVPVLLAHGARDARVDVKHAKLMASELAKRKQPVELIEYSATGHSLMLERHQLDFYTRLVMFLDKYIGPARDATANTATAGGG